MIKRKTKRKTKSKRSRKGSTKPVCLIYYKMKKCKYCKQFEKILWKKIINYCKKNNIKTYVVQREIYPEIIPKIIKTYPSLVKYDNKDKITIFRDERTLNNLS